MRRGSVVLAAAGLVLQAGAAIACETIPATAHSPLEVRKPLLGNETRLVSGFGLRTHPILAITRMHTGVDWHAPVGTTVIATGRGRVAAAGSAGELGNRVIVDHGGRWQTVYAHLQSITVGEGDCVEAGTPIAMSGTTGLTSGPQLHFEVRRDGQPVDPLMLPVLEK